MKRIVTLLTTLSLFAALSGGSPASAGVGAFTGTVRIDCFGCGPTQGQGDFTLFPGGPFHAEFTSNEPGGILCVVVGEAQGWFSGAVNGFFTWTRIGTQLVITTNGLPGSGTMVLEGVTCGASLSATVSGTLVF